MVKSLWKKHQILKKFFFLIYLLRASKKQIQAFVVAHPNFFPNFLKGKRILGEEACSTHDCGNENLRKISNLRTILANGRERFAAIWCEHGYLKSRAMIGSDLELPSSHSHVKTNQYNEVSQVFCSPFKLYICFLWGGFGRTPKKQNGPGDAKWNKKNFLTIRIMGS